MRYTLKERKNVRNGFKRVYDVVVSRTPDFSRNTVELVFSDEFECYFNVIARVKSDEIARTLARKLQKILC